MSRRRFLHTSVASALTTLLPQQNLWAQAVDRSASAEINSFSMPFGADGTLSVLSDGYMQLPGSFLMPEGVDEAEVQALLRRYQLQVDAPYQPDCNITLWQTPERTVLFDVGAGSQFMTTTGELPFALEDAGIDPLDVTDVVFTHAHPDHLWGLLDDFDDLLYPNATYHINQQEIDYWLADDTLHKTPEARQVFVVGAQSRLPLIQEQMSVFQWGDELLPGVEAVDTRGHTPGHTSFALHQDGESMLIVGDALINVALSFEKPRWPSGSDQDPQQAIATRQSLLERLVVDDLRFIAYHLPLPGFGRAEKNGNAYKFIADVG